MVVGGWNGDAMEQAVQLISLDPINHPVPTCLKMLGPFPVPVMARYEPAGGAVVNGIFKHI